MIRALATGDRDAIERVLRSDRTFRQDEIAVALALVDASLAGDADYRILVAGEPALGYLCYGPTPMTRASYDLYWIAVHADARGRGLARALVAAMETAIGRGNVRVETSPADGHAPARAMYERLGYPLVARLADFYAPGEDLLVYYKRL